MSSKTIITVIGFVLVSSLAYVGFADAVSISQHLQTQKQEIQKLNSQYKDLDKQLDKTIETKQQSEQEVKKLEQEKQNLETERQKLESELQARVDAKAKLAAASSRVINAATSTQPAYAATGGGVRSGCGDNEYAAYIYGQESGGRVTGNCNTTSRNAGGCYGIGQACPGSKLAYCGADYACQNTFFNNYAISRYGSWASAYNFHRANGWW